MPFSRRLPLLPFSPSATASRRRRLPPSPRHRPHPPAPPFETTKVEGTDNVYIFRNGNHQSMFIVTKAGVIATDPIAYGRPTGGQTYVDEIKKVTNQPIKYLIYSHHHYDHIAGGKAFKDAGATVVAHKRAKERLAVLKDPNTVLPDETFDSKRTINLGGTTLELSYLGLNHSDSTHRDAAAEGEDRLHRRHHPGRHVPGPRLHRHLSAGDRGVHQEGDRDGLGADDPGPSRPARRPARHQEGRAGRPHPDAGSLRRDQESSAQEGKCWEPVEKEFKLPKYATLPGYENGLPMVARRYCGLWGRGT